MFKKIAFLLTYFLLSGCAGAIFGSTLVGGYFVGSFATISDVKSEYQTQKKIRSEFSAIKKLKDDAIFEIEPLVIGNKIYLIGVAKNMIAKRYPLDFASTKYGKYKIIDEVRISDIKILQRTSDSFIKNKIKTKFIFTNGIRYGNYYFAVYGGEVVIVGSAADKYEASTVLDIISSTYGVKRVVNYIEVKDIGD